jgi:gliding motility-associated-like protein
MPSIQIAVSINVLPSNIICSGDMVTFTATATNGGTTPTYQWKVNGINVGTNANLFSTNTLSNNDQITCELTSSEMCVVTNPVVSNIIVMQVGSITPVSVSIVSNPSGIICPGSSVSFIANAVNGGTTPTYQWQVNGVNVGTNSPVYTHSALYNGDIVRCTLISSESCATNNPASSQVTISTLPSLTIDLVANPVDICPGESVTLNSTVSGGSGANYTLSLNGQSVSVPVVEYPSYSQYYYMTASDNCSSATDSVYINVTTVPLVVLTSDKLSGCQPLTVSFNSTGSETCTFFQWNFSDPNGNVSYQQKPTHIFEDAGSYAISLTVETPAGCKYTYNMANNINVYPNPTASFIMDQQTISIIEPVVNFENYSTNSSVNYWSFGDGDSSSVVNPTHNYSNTGIFTIQLVVETDRGCKDTTSSEIKVNEIVTFYAPTAFTPDYDNTNDVFVVKGVGIDNEHFKMMIYDRWGEPIFTSTDIERGWDGKISESEFVKTDTYVWLVVYRDINGIQHEKSGNVTVIR